MNFRPLTTDHLPLATPAALTRRAFLRRALTAVLLTAGAGRAGGTGGPAPLGAPPGADGRAVPVRRPLTLFLGGDVMIGRGLDQVLPHPGDPLLFGATRTDAREFVAWAEAVNGPIPRPVSFDYPWGEALAVWERFAPAARIINLETALTTSGDHCPGKGIHYRAHPANLPCLTAAGIDCSVLANNHVLDWGPEGLRETLRVLHGAGLKTAGAGTDDREAGAPAVMELAGRGRVLVFGLGCPSSGIPDDWAATAQAPGVNWLPDLSRATARRLADQVRAARRPGDLVVASIHWGGNWGYEIPWEQRTFARRLIDWGGVDLVHGHSSHHPKGIEVYHGRLILYGCGDLLNDYEGVPGGEEYRDDLVLMYFPSLDPDSGALLDLRLVPLQLGRLRLNRPTSTDCRWTWRALDRACRTLGTGVEPTEGGELRLRWLPDPVS